MITQHNIEEQIRKVSDLDTRYHSEKHYDLRCWRRTRDACHIEAQRLTRQQLQAAEEFAASRGWTRSNRRPWIELPELDHVEWFKRPGDDRPLVLLTHSYARPEQLEAWAKDHDCTLEVLPWSWWNPTKAIAALLIPAVGAQDLA